MGKRAVKSGFIYEFIAARLPTLQILAEKKVIKIHEITPAPGIIVPLLKANLIGLTLTKKALNSADCNGF